MVLVQKSSTTTLVFTSSDGRAVAEVGSQVDVGYTLDSGARAVVSLPLTALGTLAEVVAALAADEDVQALVVAATPVPEPEVPEEEPEGDGEEEPPVEPESVTVGTKR